MLLVAVVNHEHTAGAAALVRGFAPHADVLAIDSGSKLAEGERDLFALRLPNVYYSGLINAACEAASGMPDKEVLYFICSDVAVDDCGRAAELARRAFADPRLGLYAPSANESGHPQMLHRGSGGLRPAAFVEGFCFAVRLSLLAQMCPVDVSVNRLGWGLDKYLGYLALRAGLETAVDDRLTVRHRGICGYSTREARQQHDAWFAGRSRAARRFQALSSVSWCKTNPGLRLLKALPWS